MFIKIYPDFKTLIPKLEDNLVNFGRLVDSNSWQGQTNTQKFVEMQNVAFQVPMMAHKDQLEKDIHPNIPWAEKHFQERIKGVPYNPGETYKLWPYYKNIEAKGHRSEGEKFTHTYMERYWPKHAGEISRIPNEMLGIRFEYGDLKDVINLLYNDLTTRQAYLPVWFPEDTGAVHGGRVPCSIGYHFMVRNNMLYVNYQLRACDLVRHFRDDMYLTCRLAKHVLRKINDRIGPNIELGTLAVNIQSLHCFESDIKMLKHGR